MVFPKACRILGFVEVIWGFYCGHVLSNLEVIMEDFPFYHIRPPGTAGPGHVSMWQHWKIDTSILSPSHIPLLLIAPSSSLSILANPILTLFSKQQRWSMSRPSECRYDNRQWKVDTGTRSSIKYPPPHIFPFLLSLSSLTLFSLFISTSSLGPWGVVALTTGRERLMTAPCLPSHIHPLHPQFCQKHPQPDLEGKPFFKRRPGSIDTGTL